MKNASPAALQTYLESLKVAVVRADEAADLLGVGLTPGVARFGFERYYRLAGEPSGNGANPAEAPDFQSRSWALDKIRAPQAWAWSRAGEGAKILILDTPADPHHPALRSALTEQKIFLAGAEPSHHGTMVAGIAAGADAETGFWGVAPKARLYIAGVCNEESCSNVAVAQALQWGLEQGAQVASLSMATSEAEELEAALFAEVQKKGLTVVASAGNSGFNQVGFPAAYPGVIAVGASDAQDRRASFSQFGPELTLLAPGVSVPSSVPVGSGRLAQLKWESAVLPLTFLRGSKDPLNQSFNSQVIYAGLARSFEFTALNVHDQIVLARVGETTPEEKATQAAAHGARALILINNKNEPLIRQFSGEVALPVYGMDRAAGENLRAQVLRQTVNAELEVHASSYEAGSGTSLAAPFVAGTVALLKAMNPRRTPAEIKALLQASAVPLAPRPINEFGAGRVDALNAVQKVQR